MKQKIKETVSSLAYSASVIRQASGKLFTVKIILSVAGIVLPFVPIYLWRYLLNSLVEELSGSGFLAKIWLFCGTYCAVLIVEQVLRALEKLVNYKYRDQITYYLDNMMIEKVSGIELSFFDSSQLRDMLDHSWEVLESVQSLIWTLSDIFITFVRMIVSLVMLSSFNIWLVPSVVLFAIPSAVGGRRIARKEYEDEKRSSVFKRQKKYFKELFFGMERLEIKLYGLTDFFINKYEKAWGKKHSIDRKRRGYSLVIRIISTVMLAVSEFVVYVIAVFRLASGIIGVGDVAFYVSLGTGFREDFTSFFAAYDKFSRQKDELNDVRSFLEFKPQMEECGSLIPSKQPRIEFRNVSFSYPGSDKLVLENCSFIIEPGQTVGLVGKNGSGKTTIVKLLLRFYDPNSGNIMMDGIDIREYDINELRSRFGVLFQDYTSYSLTARENIAMADISRIGDDEALWVACRKSRADEFMNEWENGLEEEMTQQFNYKGKNLSGGQWQRLALARTFFRDTDIMLLDEPSAALDAIAENEIFLSFLTLAKGKSTVLISHRLSSITISDKIIVLDNGKIVEEGSHYELLKRGGEYSYLFNLQASKYLLNS